MQIFLFIILLFAVALMRVIPVALNNVGKKNEDISLIILSIFISVGFAFVLPLVLNWYLYFLFDFVLGYWTAFAFLFVLGVFTNCIDKKENN